MHLRRIKVFHKRHKNRQRENDFCTYIVEAWGTELVPTAFFIDPTFTRLPVDCRQLVRWLKADHLLPYLHRHECIKLLEKLPEKIVVFDSRRISFDFVVERENERYYWEFHEEQHLLKDNRPKVVFAEDGVRSYPVPRYLQRLLRDVWRVKHFSDFTIVWHDWFAENRGSYVPAISRGFQEHHRRGTFSFRAFCTV